jgi:tryptophan-rich sensory protein
MDIVRALTFGASVSTASLLIRLIRWLAPSSCVSFAEQRPSSRFQPPNWVFGLVWPVLYITTGVGWALMKHTVAADAMLAVVTLLCCLWLPVYLCLQWYVVATAILILAAGVTVATILVSPVDVFKWFLAPLAGWLSFATFLNIHRALH